MKESIQKALGLCVIFIGVSNITEPASIIVSLLALVIGGIVGEWINFDQRVTLLVAKFEKKAASKNNNFSKGFIPSTLLFTVGAMSIVGGIESGMSNNPQTLMVKAFLDGITSIFLSTSYGFGVVFSSIPVLVYQFAIALFASFLQPFVTDAIISSISLTGGIMLLGIGLNMLKVTDIKITNFILSPFLCILLLKIPFLMNL